MSELDAVTVLRGLFRLLIDQYGPLIAGDLVNIALRDATVGMGQVIHSDGITDGRAFLSRAQGRELPLVRAKRAR